MFSVPNFSISMAMIEAIRAKKALYCRAVDTKSWAEFDRIALPDATLVYRSAPNGLISEGEAAPHSFDSRDGFVRFFQKAFESLQTIHLVNGGEFESIAQNEVRAVFGVITHGGPRAGSGGHVVAAGYYDEVWKSVNGEWFLKSIVFDKVYYSNSGAQL